MEILPRLLPSFSRVTTAISTTPAENGNGFALLWAIMKLSAPGFDPTLQVSAPVWEDFFDILDFCHAYLLYICLQAKLGLFHDDCKKSCTFLWTIQHTEYVDIITILQTHVKTYMDSMYEYDDGYLPFHLCLVGLAQRINNNCQSRVRDILPRACCIQGYGNTPNLLQHPSCFIQGYSLQVYRTNFQDCDHDQRGFTDRFDGGCSRDAWGCTCSDGRAKNPGRRRELTGRGCYARPDHNRCIYDKDLQFNACKWVGHAAHTYDMLAQALFLMKYMKHLLNDATKEKVELAWLDRWCSQLGKPSCMPWTVMRANLDSMDMMVNNLDNQLCCDYWPNGDKPFEELDLNGSK
jgi:hypothetical protein